MLPCGSYKAQLAETWKGVPGLQRNRTLVFTGAYALWAAAFSPVLLVIW